jgi:hypothetical protein
MKNELQKEPGVARDPRLSLAVESFVAGPRPEGRR